MGPYWLSMSELAILSSFLQRTISQPVETLEMVESEVVEILGHCASTSSCPSFTCLPFSTFVAQLECHAGSCTSQI
jgi:hypothetical protein